MVLNTDSFHMQCRQDFWLLLKSWLISLPRGPHSGVAALALGSLGACHVWRVGTSTWNLPLCPSPGESWLGCVGRPCSLGQASPTLPTRLCVGMEHG